jgi:hypothetical protein
LGFRRPAAKAHVDWRIERLARFIQSGNDETGEAGLARNAWVEALMVHARNATAFFEAKDFRDDLHARHYVIDWDAARDGGDELAWLAENVAKVVHKRIAHITAYRQRVSKDDDQQLVVDIARRALRIYDRFLDRVGERRRGWFQLVQDDAAL